MGWFRRATSPAERIAAAWRTAWTQAVASPTAEALEALAAQLRTAPTVGPDQELEEEMLDALRQLVALSADLAAGRLPAIDTSHRLVGSDVCHFSAPASLPDHPAQPTGRLLLTSSRAVFTGGAGAPALGWHHAREPVQHDRDLLLARASGDDVQRYRFNTFADALCAAAIARHLVRAARRL